MFEELFGKLSPSGSQALGFFDESAYAAALYELTDLVARWLYEVW